MSYYSDVVKVFDNSRFDPMLAVTYLLTVDSTTEYSASFGVTPQLFESIRSTILAARKVKVLGPKTPVTFKRNTHTGKPWENAPAHLLDACSVLSVPWPCTEDDLKRAYRKRVIETHPDKVKGREAEFEHITKANDKLRVFFDSMK